MNTPIYSAVLLAILALAGLTATANAQTTKSTGSSGQAVIEEPDAGDTPSQPASGSGDSQGKSGHHRGDSIDSGQEGG